MGWFSRAIDGTVAAFSPERANRRAAARLRAEYAGNLRDQWKRRAQLSANGGFASAESSRDAHSWLTSKLSPNSAMEESREEMLERADSAYKNYELGANHVEGRVIRVAGCGTQLDPAIEAVDGITQAQADDWNLTLRRGWDRQAKRIGKRNQPLWKIQQVLQRHDERHGEWFVLVGDKYDPLCPTTLKIEVIHPKRVETPPSKSGDKNCRMGVQLNDAGEVAGYWIRDSHPGDTMEVGESHQFYPAYLPNGLPRVIHHFDEYEAGQVRGYPRMQVGLRRLKNAEEYGDAELERNYIAACHAAFVRTDIGLEDATAGDVTDADGRRIRQFEPGMVNYLGLADDITFSDPSGPPTSFSEFMGHQDRRFATGAGSSYEVVTNDLRGHSYSTVRVLWNIEESTVAVEHKDHADTLEAIYQHFVTRMVTRGLIEIDQISYRSEPWLYWPVRMIAPPKASIDPAREDRNELNLIEAGIRPASDLVERKNGMPADKVYARVQRDRAERRERGLEEHMPNMGRDPQPSPRAPTQIGDGNPQSSDANTDQPTAGAAAV